MTTETTAPALDRGPTHPFVLDGSHYVVRGGVKFDVGRCGHERDDPSHTKSDIENQTLGEME